MSRPVIAEESVTDVAFDLLAWLAFVGGAGLRLWATLYIGGRKSRTVVTDGPYSVCRNPLYLGSFLLTLSLALFLKSAAVLVAAVAFMLAYVAYSIPAEERLLWETFSEVYRSYCERTPRFLPRVGNYHSPDVVEVEVRALHRELRKLTGWILLPFLTELVGHLRANPWWPHLFRLP